MRTVFRVLSVACLLAIGGCGQTIDVKKTPEYQAGMRAKTMVETTTIQRDANRKYDSTHNAFDEAYWATAISAAHQLDSKQITRPQFDAIIADAEALRTSRHKSLEAAQDAAYYARRAANRSLSCSTYRGSTTCY